MDLKDLDVINSSNEGFELRLLNPKTQAELNLCVTVLGKDSDVFRKLASDQNRKRLAKMTKGGAIRLGAVSAEELDSDAVELLAACTVSWREVEGYPAVDDPAGTVKPTWTIDGNEIVCTRATVISTYVRFPWIREQVEAAVGDRANFIKG